MLATQLKGQISRDRKLVVEIPRTMAAGTVEVILLHRSNKPKHLVRRGSTHPAFGIWAKRAGVTDSIAFTKKLWHGLLERKIK